MKNNFLIFILSLLTLSANGQNSLSGKIIDKETKKPIFGATVYILDLKQGTVTDSSGAYSIKDLPEGNFMVEVKYPEYGTQIVRIDIKGTTIMYFELEENYTSINEVVVTAYSIATEKAINPIQTISIDKTYLQQTSATNIIDAVSNKPGLAQITTGAGISKPVIRGLGFNRILVLQNGIRQEGQQWGDEHGIEVDEFSINKVEIIKGPGSLAFGSDAMGGVINFITPNPLEKGKIKLNLLSSYQSNNNQQGYSLQNAGNINGYHWLLQGTKKLAGNYQNSYDGKVFNSGFSETNFNGTIGVNKKWGYSHLHFSAFNQELGLVEGERDSLGRFIKEAVVNDTTVEEQTVSDAELNSYGLSAPRQKINHFRVASVNSLILGKSRLNFSLGWQQNRRQELELQIIDEKYQEGVALYFLLNTFNYGLTYQFPQFKGWETSLGANAFNQNNANNGEEFLIPEYKLFDGGIFAITRRSFGKLYLAAGARYNYRKINSMSLYLNADDQPTTTIDSTTSIKFQAFESNFNSFCYSTGLSYSFTRKIIAKFNVASGFRSPNISELGSNGSHEGTFRYEIGNQNLKAETSVQVDGGFLMNTKHISLELDVFNNAVNNYIFAQKLNNVSGGDSLQTDEGGDIMTVFQFVQGKANLFGGEITFDIHPHPFDWLHFQNSFSYVEGRLLRQSDSTKNLPFMPAPRLQSELRAEIGDIGKIMKDVYIKVDLNHFFEQNRIYSAFGTETKTPAYTLLNFGAGSDFYSKKQKQLCSIYFTVSNILDVAYQSHLSRLKYGPLNLASGRSGIYNMGRNFNVKLIIPVQIKK